MRWMLVPLLAASLWADVSHHRSVGGPILGGLQAILRCPQPRFFSGQKIELELLIVNHRNDAVEICRPSAWDYRIPRESANYSHTHGHMTFRLVTGSNAMRIGRGGGGRQPLREPVLVLRGTSAKFKIGFDRLPAGDYEVTVVYYATKRRLIDGAAGDLTSNSIRIRVE